MQFRTLELSVAAVAGALMLAACGGGDEDDGSAQDNAPNAPLVNNGRTVSGSGGAAPAVARRGDTRAQTAVTSASPAASTAKEDAGGAVAAAQALQALAAAPAPDYAIAQTVTGTAALGQAQTFTTTITNVGTAAGFPVFQHLAYLTGPDFPTSLDGGRMSVVSAPNTLLCDARGGSAVCNSPTMLQPGASAMYVTSYVPNTAGTVSSLAQIPSWVPGDVNQANNSVARSAVVPDIGPTDLQIAGSAKREPTPGLIRYSFQVRNNGRWGVSNATVTIDSPFALSGGAGVFGTSNNGMPFASSNCTMPTPTRAVCSILSLAKGNFEVWAWLQLPVGTKATLTGSVTSTVTDSKPSDNTVRVTN